MIWWIVALFLAVVLLGAVLVVIQLRSVGWWSQFGHQEEVTTLRDGDTIELTEDQDGFVHECCDCGLRHIVYVKVIFTPRPQAILRYGEPLRQKDHKVQLRWVKLEGNLKGFDFSQGQCVRLDEGKEGL